MLWFDPVEVTAEHRVAGAVAVEVVEKHVIDRGKLSTGGQRLDRECAVAQVFNVSGCKGVRFPDAGRLDFGSRKEIVDLLAGERLEGRIFLFERLDLPGELVADVVDVRARLLERGDDGLDLIYYYSMLNGYEPGSLREETDGRVLMEGLAEGEFIFLDYDQESQETYWTDFWEFTDTMPLAVGVLLDMDSERGLVWPDLITPVKVDPSDRSIIHCS